jgi:protein SCO1/2
LDAATAASRSPEQPPAPTAATALPVLWPGPKFSALDQDGRAVTDGTLVGHVWVADFIFTRCTTTCPLISAKLLLVRQAVTAPTVRFVSFSVDPDFDTPTVLAEYASRWQTDPRWLLLTGTRPSVRDIALLMKVPLARNRSRDSPNAHTTSFFLVDTVGRVRGMYDSADGDAVTRLTIDAERLAGGDAGQGRLPIGEDVRHTAGATDRGRALFESVGCAGCHADPRVAPPLGGIIGRMVRLKEGTARAADAYLREAILEPAAHVVAGYASNMPSYRRYLSDEQVDTLVAYLKLLPAPARPKAEPSAEMSVASLASGGDAAAAEAVDPMCGMTVPVVQTSPHATYQGKTYYFCSDTCLQRFLKEPRKAADRSSHRWRDAVSD